MKYITFTVLYQDEILLIIKILSNEVKFIIMIVKLALVVKIIPGTGTHAHAQYA